MSENFLSRWSRRKRAASIPPIPPPQGEGGEDRRSEPGGGAAPTPAERAESPPRPDPLPASGEREIACAGGGEPRGQEPPPFDPATLPPIESIDAGTDVSAFLRPGVPADLAQAALRRAWVTDPAIRDFVGPAENAWDFNAPGGVPGFEPLRAIDDVQRLAAQVLGVVPATRAETAAEEVKEIAETNQATAQKAPAPQSDSGAPHDDAATQKDSPAHDS
jgi:hypothetical protein